METEGPCIGETANEVTRRRKEVCKVRLGLAIKENGETKTVFQQNIGI